MKMYRALLILGCAAVLGGCTESNIVNPENAEVTPETGIVEGIELDWNQISEELNDQFTRSEDYPYGEQIECYGEDGNVYIMVTVEDGVSKEEAAQYATEIIKALNVSVETQDFSYQSKEDKLYGSFSEENVVWIQVMPESTADDESTWLVDDAVTPEIQREILPNYTEEEAQSAEAAES